MRYRPVTRTIRLPAAVAVLLAVAPSPGSAADRSPADRVRLVPREPGTATGEPRPPRDGAGRPPYGMTAAGIGAMVLPAGLAAGAGVRC